MKHVFNTAVYATLQRRRTEAGLLWLLVLTSLASGFLATVVSAAARPTTVRGITLHVGVDPLLSDRIRNNSSVNMTLVEVLGQSEKMGGTQDHYVLDTIAGTPGVLSDMGTVDAVVDELHHVQGVGGLDWTCTNCTLRQTGDPVHIVGPGSGGWSAESARAGSLERQLEGLLKTWPPMFKPQHTGFANVISLLDDIKGRHPTGADGLVTGSSQVWQATGSTTAVMVREFLSFYPLAAGTELGGALASACKTREKGAVLRRYMIGAEDAMF